MKDTSRFARAVARFRLRAADELGARPRTIGQPYVRCRGVLAIGDDFVLASTPVPSHLVVERGARLSIGSGVVIGSGAAIACAAEIRIGDGVHIGRGVMIMDSDFHEAEAMGSPGAAAAVTVGARARIDDDVVILKGATIGAGARIGAGSVVSGPIAAGAVASGIPARARRAASLAGSGAGVDERVRLLVAEIFEVARPLETDDGPSTIARWDSLGALRLLLALEEDFALHLPEDALSGVTSVGALTALVASAVDAP